MFGIITSTGGFEVVEILNENYDGNNIVLVKSETHKFTWPKGQIIARSLDKEILEARIKRAQEAEKLMRPFYLREVEQANKFSDMMRKEVYAIAKGEK